MEFGKGAQGAKGLSRAIQAWSGRHPERPARLRRGEPAILRLIAPLALLVVAAVIACTVLGFVLARQADDFLEAEHRQALQGAIEALQAVSPDLVDVEPKLIHILERASGLKDLQFETEPTADGRVMQSLLDRKGRIIGWFHWQSERPATAMMARLLPLALLIASGFMGFIVLAMWQLSRLGFMLAKSEQTVHRLEYQDRLTSLPNHRDVLDLFEQALTERTPDRMIAFALIDLDGFDDVNDAVGHTGGDEVLLEIASRLRQTVPSDVLVGRLGSDEFALVMKAPDAGAARAAAEAARAAVSRPIWIDQVIQVSASVGLVLAPRDGTSREELMRRADLALRAAKQKGRGLVVEFAAQMEAAFDERRFIKRELARTLAARAFDVYYQPIVKAEGGAILGVEALLRWNHSSRGFIPPSVFIPVAEEAGLMDQLGEFVLRRALADAARWPELYVGVNLSPVQVRDRKLIDTVSDALAESKIEPARLILEITEGVLIDNPEEAKSQLQDLRALGVQLALDDFGSGYSSLTYLRQLPFDKLKVDRGFVAALNQSANSGVIIQAIVTLGRALGMSVVIEGVETEEQRVLLRLAGCGEMQGYLFAKPAPREEIDRLLAEVLGVRTPLRAIGAAG